MSGARPDPLALIGVSRIGRGTFVLWEQGVVSSNLTAPTIPPRRRADTSGSTTSGALTAPFRRRYHRGYACACSSAG